VKQHCVQNN